MLMKQLLILIVLMFPFCFAETNLTPKMVEKEASNKNYKVMITPIGLINVVSKPIKKKELKNLKIGDIKSADTSLYTDNIIDTLNGKVSFYGDEFHGRKTASGEIFDQNKLTAAHKTLPFGTKLLVINPKNGKSVVLTVNDRGPFVKNRVIDITKSAAKHLSILNSGIAYLEIFRL